MRSKNALYNIGSSLLLQIVVLISGFIIPKLIITAFGSNVNGLVSSITQFLGYITLLEAGIGPVVKAALYKPIADKDNSQIKNVLYAGEKFFKKLSFIFLIYIIILSVVYPLIVNNSFEFLYSMSLVLIISISIFFEYYFGMVYKLYLQAEQKTYVSSLIQIVVYILNIVGIFILVNLKINIHIVKLVSGLIFILRPIVQNIYVKKKYNISFKDVEKNYKLKHKWDGLAQHIASVVHNSTDVTILTIFLDLLEVSVYSIYSIIVKGIKSIVQSFTGGIDASFGDMIAKNENNSLNNSFDMYELFFHTLITIIYSCSIILIVPFVEIYTLGITDVNYIRPLFGVIMVLSEFMWSIRLPYSSIILAAGHFKETRIGAWIEAVANIFISIILVIKFGIVGVAIGTLIAMIIRTIEFIYHANKYILKRSVWSSLKKIILIGIETGLIVFIVKFLPTFEIISYFTWLKYAFVVFLIAAIVVISLNFFFYRQKFYKIFNLLQKYMKRKGIR